MIQSLAGVGCLCMHKCPNSGDLDMEPFTNVFLGEGSKGTSAKLSKEGVGFPPYTSKFLHALWCLVCNRYPTAQMNGLTKAQNSGGGGSVPIGLKHRVLTTLLPTQRPTEPL